MAWSEYVAGGRCRHSEEWIVGRSLVHQPLLWRKQGPRPVAGRSPRLLVTATGPPKSILGSSPLDDGLPLDLQEVAAAAENGATIVDVLDAIEPVLASSGPRAPLGFVGMAAKARRAGGYEIPGRLVGWHLRRSAAALFAAFSFAA